MGLGQENTAEDVESNNGASSLVMKVVSNRLVPPQYVTPLDPTAIGIDTGVTHVGASIFLGGFARVV